MSALPSTPSQRKPKPTPALGVILHTAQPFVTESALKAFEEEINKFYQREENRFNPSSPHKTIHSISQES